MHTLRRLLVGYAVTLVYLIFVAVVSSNDLPLFIALIALYALGAFAFGAWRFSRSMTAAGVQKQLRRPGNQVKVRIGFGGWSLKAWDPSQPLGPRNGVRGAGFGAYRLNESDDVTLTWHPVGGAVRALTGPRVAPSPQTSSARRIRRLLVRVTGIYLAILASVGLAVGLLTGKAVFGLVGVGITVCILPIAATAIRTARSRPMSRPRQDG